MRRRLGWDSPRWNAASTIAALHCVLALTLLRDRRGVPGGPGVRLSSGQITWGIGACALGLCTDYPGFLFDGYQIRWFPFHDSIDSILEIFKGDFTFRPRR